MNMNLHQPLEALLRPPLEWLTCISAWLAAISLLTYPVWFSLTGKEGYILSFVFILWGLVRARNGFQVWRYQRNLKRMPSYAMTAKQLPVSQSKLFLGKGFLWTALHFLVLTILEHEPRITSKWHILMMIG